jgi:hypothetical protein
MNQQALEDIGVAAQMRAAHPTRNYEQGQGATLLRGPSGFTRLIATH